MRNDSALYEYINLDYMDLMSGGDEDLKKTMLEMLLLELPEEIEKMHALQKEGDWEELGNVSHKMKSTLAFIGNDKMIETNKEIEQLAKNEQQVEYIPKLLTSLDELKEKVITELEQAIK